MATAEKRLRFSFEESSFLRGPWSQGLCFAFPSSQGPIARVLVARMPIRCPWHAAKSQKDWVAQIPFMIIVDASGSGECHLAQVRRDFRREPARPWHSHQPTWLHELSKLESSAQGQHGVLWTRGKVANSAREVQCCPFRVLACPSADSFSDAVFTVPSGMELPNIVSLGAP